MSVKLIALIFIFGLVAHETVQAQWFGWPYYGYPGYNYLGYYGKRSAGFDANAAVTGSTSAPSSVNAYPSGMVFASTTHAPQNMAATNEASSSTTSTQQPAKH